MGMFRTPEGHAANPPESWQVTKAADRVWRLLIAGDVADTFTTRRDAEDAKQRGRWVELYRKEGRWFAGEQVDGWKPYRPALHTLTQTHTSDDGDARTMSSDSDTMTAAEAQRSRVKRLRAAGIPFTEGHGWVEFREESEGRRPGVTVRLEWSDAPGAVRADQVQPGAYVRAAGVDEYGSAITLTGYASPGRMRYRKGLRRGAQCVALSMSETPNGAGGWRSVVFLECDAAVWPATPPADVARLAGEPPAEPAGYVLVRTTPGGITREQGPVRRVRDAAALAAQVLTDNTRTSKADAQRFAALLDGTPTGREVAHEPTGYRFRVRVAGGRAAEVAPEVAEPVELAPVAEPVTTAEPVKPTGPKVPTVEPCDDGEGVRRLTTAETAALVRAAVKAAFPGVKFSVRSETYSMGSSVHVTWTDGPAASAVEKITDAYRGADFDGMQDLKTYRGPVQVTDTRGRVQRVQLGADYVITHRNVSEGYAAKFERLASDILGEPVQRSRWYDGDYASRWGVWQACAGHNLLLWLAERVDPADLAEPETPAEPEPVAVAPVVGVFADLLAARR